MSLWTYQGERVTEGQRFRVKIAGAKLEGRQALPAGPCTVAVADAYRPLKPRLLEMGEVVTFVWYNHARDFAAPEFVTADGYRGEFSPTLYGTVKREALEKLS